MAKILAFDTSCYTTSAAFWQDGRLIHDKRRILDVPQGQKGLRQSEAVFQHLQNLPGLLAHMQGVVSSIDLLAVSNVPRRQQGSYMPVFTAGTRIAECLGNLTGKPVFYASHQEGHIGAGEWSSGFLFPDLFLAGHFSGGTTELLKVEKRPFGYQCEILAATSDIHAGQMIDRAGVALGMPFPAGPSLEKLALEVSNDFPELPFSVRENKVSFSGPATAALRLIEKGLEPARVAKAVLFCIARAVCALIRSAVISTGLDKILLVGGVMANSYIREQIKKEAPGEIYYAGAGYSTDNAAGLAFLGERFFENGGGK